MPGSHLSPAWAAPLLLAAAFGIAATQDGPALTGILRDESGKPLAHSTVQACTSSVCFSSETGTDGRFRFALPLKPPVNIVVKTPENLAVTPRRGEAMVPVRFTGQSLVDVGAVFVPNLSEGTPLPPTGSIRRTVTTGDGLELTMRRADLTAAIGDVLMDLAARRLPANRVPAYVLPAHERVVAVYALHPFGATSASPIGVRAPSTLPAGTPVTFRTLNALDGSFSLPVSGRATGQHVVTDGASGITELTHLVITR